MDAERLHAVSRNHSCDVRAAVHLIQREVVASVGISAVFLLEVALHVEDEYLEFGGGSSR